MAEEQVSVDGHSHPLPQPFIVLATDNPIEYEGTYPLPEAQLDRFGIRVRIGYLPAADEVEMLSRRVSRGAQEPTVRQVLDAGALLAMRGEVESVAVEPDVLDYVVRIVAATRNEKDVLVGASPRASLALLQLARARAMLDGRDYVVPEDVKALAVPALSHRLSLRPEMWVRRIQAEDIVARMLSRVAAPRTSSPRGVEPVR
jgi:MoxR-like ATPase